MTWTVLYQFGFVTSYWNQALEIFIRISVANDRLHYLKSEKCKIPIWAAFRFFNPYLAVVMVSESEKSRAPWAVDTMYVTWHLTCSSIMFSIFRTKRLLVISHFLTFLIKKICRILYLYLTLPLKIINIKNTVWNIFATIPSSSVWQQSAWSIRHKLAVLNFYENQFIRKTCFKCFSYSHYTSVFL